MKKFSTALILAIACIVIVSACNKKATNSNKNINCALVKQNIEQHEAKMRVSRYTKEGYEKAKAILDSLNTIYNNNCNKQ